MFESVNHIRYPFSSNGSVVEPINLELILNITSYEINILYHCLSQWICHKWDLILSQQNRILAILVNPFGHNWYWSFFSTGIAFESVNLFNHEQDLTHCLSRGSVITSVNHFDHHWFILVMTKISFLFIRSALNHSVNPFFFFFALFILTF